MAKLFVFVTQEKSSKSSIKLVKIEFPGFTHDQARVQEGFLARRMTAVILKILHPFKYPKLRVISSDIDEKFIHKLSAMFTCRDGKGGEQVGGPPKRLGRFL